MMHLRKFQAKVALRFASYPTIRVSSHLGCNLGCLHCKLTYAKKDRFSSNTPASIIDFQKQLTQGLSLLPSLLQLEHHKIAGLKVDFSGKGEPLENEFITKQWLNVYNAFTQVPLPFPVRCSIETIMPDSFASSTLPQAFLSSNEKEKDTWPTLTYNLMSSNEKVKSKWMPSAMPTCLSIVKLRDYQDAIYERTFDRKLATSKVKVKLVLVENVNDHLEDIAQTLFIMQQYGLKARIDLHRFVKPTFGMQHKPTSVEKIQTITDLINRQNSEGAKLCF